MEKIKPKRGGVIIEPIPPAGEVATKAGIFVPDSAIEKHVLPKGKVVAVGASIFLSNGREVPPLYEVGETVYYSKASKAVELTLNGKECLLLTENEIHYGDGDSLIKQLEKELERRHLTQARSCSPVDSLGSKVGKSTPKNS